MTAKLAKQANQPRKLVQGLIDNAAEKFPKYKTQIQKIGPIVVAAADGLDTAYPYAVRAWNRGCELWEQIQPYHPQQYAPALLGFLMCFFGGSFVSLIAAAEAVRLVVWQQLWGSLSILYRNYKAAESASKKDDQVDNDGNGVADVEEINDRELLTRKMYVFAGAVDAAQVSDAITSLWGGLIAVVSTLRMHFAKTVTLGHAIGEVAAQYFSPSTLPVIEAALPEHLKRWAAPLDSFGYKLIAIIFAWALHRFMTAFHAAFRGANLLVNNAITLAKQRGMLDTSFDEHGQKATIFAAALAFIGFYWQLTHGFSVPFPLNIPLLPLILLDWFLTVTVSMI